VSALADTPIGHPVASAVAQIAAVLDDVSDSSMWSMTDESLLVVAEGAGRLVGRVQELMVRLVGEIDSRDLACTVGASTTTGWVRHRLNATLREAKQIAAVARAAGTTLSVTGRALAAGKVSLAQAGAIVGAVQALPTDLDHSIAARAEADLIARAAHFDAEQLTRLGEHILQVVAPEIGAALEAKRLADQDKRAEHRRTFTITPDGHGLEWLRGALDTEAAATLRAALEPLSAPRPNCADGADPRSTAHRRGDALVELARRALAAGDLPDIGGERPHVAVTMPLAALLAGPGAPPWTTAAASHRRLRGGWPVIAG